MTTVLIRVPTGELSEKMAGMREWLNEHRSEPSKFTCDRYGSIFAVCVDFSNDGEAEAFQKALQPTRSNFVPFNPRQWLQHSFGKTKAR